MTVRDVLCGSMALLCVASTAGADEVVLTNGRTLKGKVTETVAGVVLEKDGLKVTLKKDEVAEVRRAPTDGDVFRKRLAALREDDADGHYRLGLWADDHGLAAEAKARFEAVVALDGDHAGARRALGQLKGEDGWAPRETVLKERGLVQVDGAWVSPREAEALRRGDEKAAAERKAREKERRDRRTLNVALRRLADPDAAERRRGERELVTVAKERGDHDTVAKAPEVRAWYDNYYRELATARAMLEVRAQVVTLKRPIPTFQTSLGGFSSPVTLQLPEVSVIRINTTVLVPVQIDDWED